jgi:hypothetical protein
MCLFRQHQLGQHSPQASGIGVTCGDQQSALALLSQPQSLDVPTRLKDGYTRLAIDAGMIAVGNERGTPQPPRGR